MNIELPTGNNLLLTGPSGVGKSTLLKRVGMNLQGLNVKGFYSEVVWEDDERVGWRLDTFDGDGGLLVHLGMDSEFHMGKYGVDMTLFECLTDSQLRLSDQTDIYHIDEIGIIASWSPLFINLVAELLDSPKKVLAIVRQRGEGFNQQVKERPDVSVLDVTLENRVGLYEPIVQWATRVHLDQNHIL